MRGVFLAGASVGMFAFAIAMSQGEPQADPGRELPVRRVTTITNAAGFISHPAGRSFAANAKRDGDAGWRVYTMNIDGTGIRRINDRGDDACSYFFPDGKRIVWTSTRDHPQSPKGDYADPTNYPQ